MGLLCLMNLHFPESQPTAAIVLVTWCFGSLPLLLTLRSSSGVARWKLLLLSVPYTMAIAILLIAGEFYDLLLFLVPPMMIGVGYSIAHYADSPNVSVVTVVTAVVLGWPSVLITLSGEVDPFAELLGLSPAETRLGALAMCGLLSWMVVLSACRKREAPLTLSESK